MSNSEESSLGKVLKEISGLIGNFPELSLELNNIKNAPNTSMMQGMYDALKRNNPNLPSLLFDTENLVPSSTEKETKKENPEESKDRSRRHSFSGSSDRKGLIKIRLDDTLKEEATSQVFTEIDSTEPENKLFREWKEAMQKSPNSRQARKLRIKLIRQNNKRIKEKYNIERIRVHENPESDPIVNELSKIMLELDREHAARSPEEKSKDPSNLKARNDALGAFAEQFPEKASEYAKWHQKNQNNDRAVVGQLKNPLTWLTLRDLASYSNPLPKEILDQQPLGVRQGEPAQETSEIPSRDMEQPQQSTPGSGSRNLANRPGRNSRKSAGKEAEKLPKQVLQQTTKNIFSLFTGNLLLILIIILLLLGLLMIVFGSFFSGGGSTQQNQPGQPGQLGITKTPQTQAINFKDNAGNINKATFNINVTYSGSFDQIVVTDPIPDNATYNSCNPFCNATVDTSGKITSVSWTLTPDGASANSTTAVGATTTTAGSTGFTDYAKYGLPQPDSPNPYTSSSTYQKFTDMWNNYMAKPALKAAPILGVDAAMLAGWTLSEGITTVYQDLCSDGNRDPNTPCVSGDWQVGYGVQPFGARWLTLDKDPYNLQSAINNMYPAGTDFYDIIQRVMQDSKTRPPQVAITNPSSIDRSRTLQQLITAGRSGDQSARQLISILMKDDAISAYMTGVVTHYYAAMGQKMGADKTYAGTPQIAQRRSNAIDALYKLIGSSNANPGTTTGETGNFSQTLTLDINPNADNSWIVNQASAEVIGGTTGTTTGTTTGGTTTTAPIIVIDPGHSGSNLTTIDPTTGIRDEEYHNPGETETVFVVAEKLKSKLEAAGYQVYMTKDNAEATVSKIDRVKIANDHNAALAVSIHTSGSSFGNWGQIYLQTMQSYRETDAGKKVYFKDIAPNAANVAALSQQYGQNILVARNAIENNSVKITVDSFNGRYAPNGHPLAKGNVSIVQLLSKVPWVYNEAGALSNDTQENNYAQGLFNGIVKSVPITTTSTSIPASTPVSLTTSVGTTTTTPANNSTCGGKYSLTGKHHTGVNFGDPDCALVNSPIISSNGYNVHKPLYDEINSMDSSNLGKWLKLSYCESIGFDPNAYLKGSTSGLGAYGLFQMNPAVISGKPAPYSPVTINGKVVSGLNGQYDRGDVQWSRQTSNAINHSNAVKYDRKWCYWGCARCDLCPYHKC